MDRKALLYPCGLILGPSYLSTTLHSSFAFDRPLHTVAVVLLLSGLAIVAYETWASKHRQPSPDRYVAIPLSDGNGRPSSEEIWVPGQQGDQRRSRDIKTLGALLAGLLFAVCARAAIFHHIVKDVECSAPSALAFLPLVLALFHGFRPPHHRQSPAWSAESSSNTQLERVLHFVFHGSTRYILPTLLLSISSFLTTFKTSSLHSTYICPQAGSTASNIPILQFLGFVVDCILLLILSRLIEDGLSQHDDPTIALKDGISNNSLVGYAFIAATFVLGVAGIIIYAALPEHRQWMLQAPREYLLSLLRLSLMIPFTMLCFLSSARMYGVMSAVLIAAFSSAYIGVLQALGTGVSYSFPPKSTTSLVLCLTLLTIALILHLVTNSNVESNIRSKIPVRLGRNQTISFVVVLIVFSIGVVIYRYHRPVPGHPITTLISLANEQHEQWASQAHRSKSLAEAVVHYQARYSRDPPPNFDKWYDFATSRNSIVIDDFDNIEEDLSPFSSVSPADLRLRTAQVLANNDGLGGIRIRQGKVEVFANVPGTHRWMVDGAVHMIEKFAEFLPDMDLAFNLNDECRVAVPYVNLRWAHDNREHYPWFDSDPPQATVNFSSDRDSTWLELEKIPKNSRLFEDARLKPSFQTYGSIACPPDSRARKDREWDTSSFCSKCVAPHSMGAFISNWTLSANACHQPDLANLHGLYLSPSALMGTHNLVPIFSQSRAPGYADIRYPSPWNYMDKVKYEFDEKFPDPHFTKKENILFWRGATSEGVSTTGVWKGMLRQRFVHLLNNETSRQPILLPTRERSGRLDYSLEYVNTIKRHLEVKTDARFVNEIVRCGGQDCNDQAHEFGLGNSIEFKQHWRYRYLFDTDGAGFSGRFIPFLQSNSVVFKAAIFREWYEGRLTAWKHFVPVDVRLHDLFSSLAYFGGYGLQERVARMMEPREKDAEGIARAGKVWTEKVLRKEDMEVYMFRLLLEWGRLTDDRRREVGYRLDGRGRKGKEHG